MGPGEDRIEIPESTSKYPIKSEDIAKLENAFVYHAPKPDQPPRYVGLRDLAKDLAYMISKNCPPSRERSLAITKLEESVMWANASIARNE